MYVYYQKMPCMEDDIYICRNKPGWLRLIQQKPVLRINPTLGKSMNPGAIKIIWFERARRTGAVQRICIAPRSIPVEQEQDSVLRKGEMSILKNI